MDALDVDMEASGGSGDYDSRHNGSGSGILNLSKHKVSSEHGELLFVLETCKQLYTMISWHKRAVCIMQLKMKNSWPCMGLPYVVTTGQIA